MAATQTTPTAPPAPDRESLARSGEARSTDQVTRTPDAPRARGVRPALDYALLAPPTYDNIVGGAPPSPIASVLLAAGALLIVVAIVQTALGAADTSQWWGAGVILAAVGLFLAAFVSRRA